MDAVDENRKHVIIGAVVTDRPSSLGRLLASLQPVDDDPRVHVIVLDNGTQPSEIRSVVDRAASRARGQRLSVRSKSARAPLHKTRVQLSREIASWVNESCGSSPVVWLVDDDVSFERLYITDGKLECENISVQRIDEVRRLARLDNCDVLVSGFTGDPPVRPNAVLSCQLADLTAELRRLTETPLDQDYRAVQIDSSRYRGDYYYAHRENEADGFAATFPWLVRPAAGGTVAEQLACMLAAAAGISRGRGVFRPLVEVGDRDPMRIVESSAPNRGGNAVFFGLEPLLAHRYPSFAVGGGFSRRGDMIGTALLARFYPFRIAEGSLSLRHDRTGQKPVDATPTEWKCEFAGVLLARMVMRGVPTQKTPHGYLREIALERAQRIQRDARTILVNVQRALAALDEPSACWWNDSRCRELASALRASLLQVGETLRTATQEHIFEQLNTDDLIQKVLRVREDLSPSRSAV